jgi:hypothetical protein
VTQNKITTALHSSICPVLHWPPAVKSFIVSCSLGGGESCPLYRDGKHQAASHAAREWKVPGSDWAPRHAGVWGSGGIAPRILNLGTSLFRVDYGLLWSRGSSGSFVSDYGLDDRGSIPWQGQRIFLLASASRPALGPTQPPIQWVPGVLSPG